jgi:tRNA-2-methylthio-N6-dimethylallyladenosine synthase
MNVHDSEHIAGVLKGEGYALTGCQEDADIIVLNTCSIRQKAEQKFYSHLGMLAKLKMNKPGLKIAVSGCIAQQEGENIFKTNPHVDMLFGPQNIARMAEFLKAESINTGVKPAAVETNENLHLVDLPAERADGAKAWVNIMYGCNNYCSYCIVPHTRGRERSRPLPNIVDEITALAQVGFKEITLLGQNVNSYHGESVVHGENLVSNTEGHASFSELLKAINGIDGIQRIRFMTSHPRDLTRELARAFVELDKLCPHIHLPLQSGSDRMLKLMNRKYSYDDYFQKISMLRTQRPDIAITTDIIAGFPTEEDKDHEDTVSALKEIRYDGIFAFKYSRRPLTKAASMDGHIDEVVKSQRLKEILEVQDVITSEINANLVNTEQEVLIEGQSAQDVSTLTGRTPGNKIVNFQASEGLSLSKNMTVRVRITRAFRHSLEGQVISISNITRP